MQPEVVPEAAMQALLRARCAKGDCNLTGCNHEPYRRAFDQAIKDRVEYSIESELLNFTEINVAVCEEASNKKHFQQVKAASVSVRVFTFLSVLLGTLRLYHAYLNEDIWRMPNWAVGGAVAGLLTSIFLLLALTPWKKRPVHTIQSQRTVLACELPNKHRLYRLRLTHEGTLVSFGDAHYDDTGQSSSCSKYHEYDVMSQSSGMRKAVLAALQDRSS